MIIVSEKLMIGPLAIAASPTVLGVLIIMSVGWIVLRICWKRQWCCPRIWRSSFWLLFFCYDCCTHNPGGNYKVNHISLKMMAIL